MVKCRFYTMISISLDKSSRVRLSTKINLVISLEVVRDLPQNTTFNEIISYLYH